MNCNSILNKKIPSEDEICFYILKYTIIEPLF